MDMRKWFKEAQYGMMVHWGLYSLLAGEYKDRYSGVYAEWIQANLAIPNAEYGKLAKHLIQYFSMPRNGLSLQRTAA
mgnify:CR=1 FL=1